MEKRLSELSASAQSERGSLARAQNVAFLSEAVQCLSEQMETSAPFDQELRAVEQLAARFGGDDGKQLQAAISQCAAAVALDQKSGSGGGLATRAELASQFELVEGGVRKAEYLPADRAPKMTETVLANVADWAKVTPANPMEGETMLARLARARHQVGQGKLAEAVLELEKLTGRQVISTAFLFPVMPGPNPVTQQTPGGGRRRRPRRGLAGQRPGSRQSRPSDRCKWK